jgi:hypothetical protein
MRLPTPRSLTDSRANSTPTSPPILAKATDSDTSSRIAVLRDQQVNLSLAAQVPPERNSLISIDFHDM